MSNQKLFVGSLSWDTTESSLRAAFEKFGSISEARIITDRETGRSRGFGFITFDSADEARQAMQEMDGKELDGRAIIVNEARERRRGGGGGGGGHRGGGGGGGYRGGGGGGGGYGDRRPPRRNNDRRGGGGGGYGGGGYGDRG